MEVALLKREYGDEAHSFFLLACAPGDCQSAALNASNMYHRLEKGCGQDAILFPYSLGAMFALCA